MEKLTTQGKSRFGKSNKLIKEGYQCSVISRKKDDSEVPRGWYFRSDIKSEHLMIKTYYQSDYWQKNETEEEMKQRRQGQTINPFSGLFITIGDHSIISVMLKLEVITSFVIYPVKERPEGWNGLNAGYQSSRRRTQRDVGQPPSAGKLWWGHKLSASQTWWKTAEARDRRSNHYGWNISPVNNDSRYLTNSPELRSIIDKHHMGKWLKKTWFLCIDR